MLSKQSYLEVIDMSKRFAKKKDEHQSLSSFAQTTAHPRIRTSARQSQRAFWKNKRVFLTGHTGFKGAWLSIWLTSMGARVCGYALKPNTKPSLFTLAGIGKLLKHNIGDIRSEKKLKSALKMFKPEIVIHMAAQPLVRQSYKDPVETFQVNVQGTVNLLEAARSCGTVRVILNITTDKVDENLEKHHKGYREGEKLGGHDPYSASKACSEIVTASYRNSFFNVNDFKNHKVAVATARAGNVIGGGDWANDRLIPDCVNAVLNGKRIEIRNPGATRPWQHVLEPLGGYLLLCERLFRNGPKYSGAWNIGPDSKDCKPVGWVASEFCGLWGSKKSCAIQAGRHPHEAHFLKLDNAKAKKQLGWHPKWDIETALKKVVEWNINVLNGVDAREECLRQIYEFEHLTRRGTDARMRKSENLKRRK